MTVFDTLINTLFDGRYRIMRKLGSGRDGRRLPRRGRGARPARGDQDPERPARERRAVRRALPPRGEERGRALAPEHRLHLRPRRGRGHLLHRDGVPRRPQPQGARRRAGPAADPGRDRGHAPGARSAAVRASQGRRPPRHQAAQRDGRRGRAPEGDGLRDRAGGREPDDRGRVDHRHGAVPLARAGARHGGRPALRPLLGRHRALRDADRRGAVHGRLAGRDRDEAPLGYAAAALAWFARRSHPTWTWSSCARWRRARRIASRRPRRWTRSSSGSRQEPASPQRPRMPQRPSCPEPLCPMRRRPSFRPAARPPVRAPRTSTRSRLRAVVPYGLGCLRCCS